MRQPALKGRLSDTDDTTSKVERRPFSLCGTYLANEAVTRYVHTRASN